MFCLSSGAQSGRLRTFSVGNLSLQKNERIVGLEVDVAAGAFDSITKLPVGWTVTIDNDASWQTKVQASVQVGAASLSPESLQKVLLIVRENEFGDLKFNISGIVIVTTDFKTERRIPLRQSDFLVRN
jgi:hypothetical protein